MTHSLTRIKFLKPSHDKNMIKSTKSNDAEYCRQEYSLHTDDGTNDDVEYEQEETHDMVEPTAEEQMRDKLV
jgi:hypothetical protein